MTSVYSSNYVTDGDQFGVPRLGGDVAVRYGTVTFEDTSATTLFDLPQGAVVVDAMVEVTTAFDDSGTDQLDVGLGSDGDYFVNNLDVSSTGVSRYGATGFIAARAFGDPLENNTAVTATYTGQNGDATEGEAVVAVWYIRK